MSNVDASLFPAFPGDVSGVCVGALSCPLDRLVEYAFLLNWPHPERSNVTRSTMVFRTRVIFSYDYFNVQLIDRTSEVQSPSRE